MSDDSSTASKALAGTSLSSLMSALGHAGSAVPPKYQFEPLSARIKPYCCMARRTTWAWGENVEMSKLAFSRNRVPMGGRLGLSAAPAAWRAGQMNALSVVSAVMRMAWVMAPDCTSS
jgi:hypothetical protein